MMINLVSLSKRMHNMRILSLIAAVVLLALPARGEIFLGQGTMSGEVSDTSALLQTRLTQTDALDSAGDIPGTAGVACFEWSEREDFGDSKRTPFQVASQQHDYIVRAMIENLRPGTRYFYRAIYGVNANDTQEGPTCSLKTLPGIESTDSVHFIMASCMNYNKFMYGKAGAASGPVTASEEDKRLGFPAFVAMKTLQPDFFIGTGDIVYYDNKINGAETVSELRECWHEQFRFPRLIEFFRNTPGYWSKDDHDFRFNDSDNASERLPLPATGIELFREQMPILSMEDRQSPTYNSNVRFTDLTRRLIIKGCASRRA